VLLLAGPAESVTLGLDLFSGDRPMFGFTDGDEVIEVVAFDLAQDRFGDIRREA